ncbi:MAG: ABC transporter ATP-binding protein [Oscillospiraceae bacterium]|nr:ABC transporter ATP-binding protein [Oscillospiraceae bacterium]
MAEPIVRFEHVSMQFPGVLANDDVSLDINQGEVFALIGENGAGKSTLMNVLYGLNEPTGGALYVKGKRIERQTTDQAISMGVGMVHQHFKLVGSFTVAQNVLLCCEPKKKLCLYDFAKAEETVRKLSADFGLDIDPSAKVQSLSVGMQQRVEILKTLYRGADVLILDEPTAVLTPQETDELFRVIRGIVRDKGMTVIIITHKLYEVMAISDRVGVMRGGRLVGLRETKDVDERMLASMMVGRDMLLSELQKFGWVGRTLIRTEDLYVQSDRMLPAVRCVSLEVREGEILGIAGIDGNGQSELVEAITGMRPIQAGRVLIDGVDVWDKVPGEVRDLGLAHIPEDHLATGLSIKSSVEENLLVGKQRLRDFAFGGWHLRRSAIHDYARKLFDKFDIRGAGIDTEAGALSGGNMQKVVIAREFSLGARALIVSQPTRGVDIGAIEFIHKSIVDKRNAGCAVLLVSADLDEVFRLSDRIITMYEGRITGSFRAGEIDKESIGYYMTGARDKETTGK